jgi:ribosomal protein L25 (general stress protein Ctc)
VSSINNEKNTEQASGRIRRLKDGQMSKAVIYDYRHSQVYTLASHGHTRDKRYKLLGFEVEGEHNKVTNKKTRGKTFGRGYR